MPEFKYKDDAGVEQTLDVHASVVKQISGEAFNDGQSKSGERFAKLLSESAVLKDIAGESHGMKEALDKLNSEFTRLSQVNGNENTEMTELRTEIAKLEDAMKRTASDADEKIKLEGLKTSVKGSLISLGLDKEYHEDISYFFDKHFTVDKNANGDYVFTKKSDGKVLLDEGEPASPAKVAEWFLEEKKGWFSQAKGGLGTTGKSGQGQSAGGMDIKASTDDLLMSGLREIKKTKVA